MLIDVSSFSYWDEYSEAAISLDLMTRGKLHPADMITNRFPLEAINEAFDVAARKKETNAIKVMIIQNS
jgi:threonine dehydrogenase-like Zn-dependent dehydrogenase